MGASIFVVDSSPAVRRMVEEISIREGYEVIGFQDGPKALEAARQTSPSLILADFHLENMTFSGFCKEIGKLDNLAETLVISLVDPSDKLDESKLRALGVRAFLKKPFQHEQLLDTINGILNDATGKRAAQNLRSRAPGHPFSRTQMMKMRARRRIASADDAPYDETEKEPTAMSPLPSQLLIRPLPLPRRLWPTAMRLMKGLFDHLLQSVVLQADRKITDLLPSAITGKWLGKWGCRANGGGDRSDKTAHRGACSGTSPDCHAGSHSRGIATSIPGSSCRRRNHSPPSRLRPGPCNPGIVCGEATG